jgi:hypothetical protein
MEPQQQQEQEQMQLLRLRRPAHLMLLTAAVVVLRVEICMHLLSSSFQCLEK